MPQNTTESPAADLSPAQALALAALLRGASVTAAAEKAVVGRETVHRWLRDDPAFIAEYHAGKAEIVGAARAELRSLAVDAVARLRTLISKENPEPYVLPVQFKAVVEVLKMTGVAMPEPDGPTDPREIAVRQAEAAAALDLDELIAGV